MVFRCLVQCRSDIAIQGQLQGQLQGRIVTRIVKYSLLERNWITFRIRIVEPLRYTNSRNKCNKKNEEGEANKGKESEIRK